MGEACGAEGASEADAGKEGGAHLNGCRHGAQHVQHSSCGRWHDSSNHGQEHEHEKAASPEARGTRRSEGGGARAGM